MIDPRPYQADLDRAAAGLDRTQAELKLAQIELDRAREPRAKNTISGKTPPIAVRIAQSKASRERASLRGETL